MWAKKKVVKPFIKISKINLMVNTIYNTNMNKKKKMHKKQKLFSDCCNYY